MKNDYNVTRLQRWLDYELSTAMLLLLSWFWNLALLLMIIAAILFTPFMLKVLLDEKRFGWITFFIILVIMPIISFFIWDINSSYKFILELIPLALFYFYCFILRLAIKSW
jgi:hypothetical protein